MKKLFHFISLKVSLTETEVKAILYVLIIFFVGLTVKYYGIKITEKPIKKYQFSFHDSLNKAIENEEINLSAESNFLEKRVDSERELSDFSTNKLVNKKKLNSTLKERSINLNSADLEVLVKLPGIGSKTAQKIIDLRIKKNGFKAVEDLIEVKGIGKSKLKNIKEYLFIEK